MKGKNIARHAFAQKTNLTATATKKPKDPAPDYCLTCRVPVGKCKGNCTKQQQKLNGGNLL